MQIVFQSKLNKKNEQIKQTIQQQQIFDENRMRAKYKYLVGFFSSNAMRHTVYSFQLNKILKNRFRIEHFRFAEDNRI